MIKITIGQPSRGSIAYQHQQCLDALYKAMDRHPSVLSYTLSRIYGCSLIEHSRSLIATEAYLGDADVLLWLDDDMIFDADQVLTMCFEAIERNAIVGAVASTKGMGGQCNTKFLPGVHTVKFFEPGSVQQVHTIGAGICAVSHNTLHDVAGQLLDKYGAVTDANGSELIPFHKSVIHQGMTWGEDTSFCLRAGWAGHNTYADTRVRALHKGDHLFGLEELSQQTVRHPNLSLVIDPSARKRADEADAAAQRAAQQPADPCPPPESPTHAC